MQTRYSMRSCKRSDWLSSKRLFMLHSIGTITCTVCFELMVVRRRPLTTARCNSANPFPEKLDLPPSSCSSVHLSRHTWHDGLVKTENVSLTTLNAHCIRCLSDEDIESLLPRRASADNLQATFKSPPFNALPKTSLASLAVIPILCSSVRWSSIMLIGSRWQNRQNAYPTNGRFMQCRFYYRWWLALPLLSTYPHLI